MADADTSNSRVRVVARIRPLLGFAPHNEAHEIEVVRKADSRVLCLSRSISEGDQKTRPEEHLFTFNAVFDHTDSQMDLYDEVCQNLCDDVLNGSNVTLFTYGQTGSGKTFTVLGESSIKQGVSPESGLFIRSVSDLLEVKAMQSRKGRVSLDVRFAGMEIYLENLKDLITGNEIKIMNEKLVGLHFSSINSMEDAMKLYSQAQQLRTTKSTMMNDVSSRSHAVFLIDVLQQPTGGGAPSSTRFTMCDLAGSERMNRSHAEKREAAFINSSLSTLSLVVKSIAEGSKAPYRNSLLTRVLQPSMEGQSARIVLCANFSPSQRSFSESMSTARFADGVLELEKLPQFEYIRHDVHAEECYKCFQKKLDELSAEVRICTARHRHILQTPQMRHFLRVERANGREVAALVKVKEVYAALVVRRRQRRLAAFVSQRVVPWFINPNELAVRYNKWYAKEPPLYARLLATEYESCSIVGVLRTRATVAEQAASLQKLLYKLRFAPWVTLRDSLAKDRDQLVSKYRKYQNECLTIAQQADDQESRWAHQQASRRSAKDAQVRALKGADDSDDDEDDDMYVNENRRNMAMLRGKWAILGDVDSSSHESAPIDPTVAYSIYRDLGMEKAKRTSLMQATQAYR